MTRPRLVTVGEAMLRMIVDPIGSDRFVARLRRCR